VTDENRTPPAENPSYSVLEESFCVIERWFGRMGNKRQYPAAGVQKIGTPKKQRSRRVYISVIYARNSYGIFFYNKKYVKMGGGAHSSPKREIFRNFKKK
jgi:hypothetical protein